MKKHSKKITMFIVIIIAIVIFRVSGLGDYFTFEYMKDHSNSLKEYLDSHFIQFTLGFIGIYLISAALSLPWATLLTMLSGFLYGTIKGVIIVNIGATFGSLLAFWAARYIFREGLKSKYGDKLEKIDNEIQKNGISYMLFLRLIPVFPFFLINLAAGLTDIPARKFALTTMIGIIPGSAVYAFAGQSLNSIESASEILTPEIIMAFVLLGLFALVPTLYQKFKIKTSN